MHHYTHGHGRAVLRAHRNRSAANSCAHLLPLLQPGLSLLDIGCGEGWITRDLARLVAPGQVVGVDLSAKVIHLAQAGGDIPDNLTFLVADVYDLPFDAATFDVTHLHQVLHHVDDPVGAIRAARRVTKPGGLVSDREGDYGAVTWYPPSRGWEVWQKVYLAVGYNLGNDPRVALRLGEVAAAAGLVDIVQQSSLWTYPGFATAADYAESWAERMTDPDFFPLIRAAGVATKGELAMAAAELRRWGQRPDAFFAFPHGELLARVPD
ncbi:MAG: methyltransferase domain-containing protein [Propionibacteriaceae bacterium]|nr:methyltransferase domain-containing protein [Propionibacteriaceae bacterium]